MLGKGDSKVKLGDCLTVLTDYHANGSYERLRENVTLLDEPDYAVMIRTTNFEKEDFVDGLKYINEHAYNFLAKSKVYPGDILMNKIASPGSVFRMPNLRRPVSLAMNLFLLRTDETRLDQTYAYYWLKAHEDYVKSFTCGAATATITKRAVRELEMSIPQLSAQRRIAGILSAYDDLIENNQRRIKILEEMARSLYREWFVNFRFPRHEKVPVVDSLLGPSPKGWKLKSLPEVLEINPRITVPRDGDRPFVPLGSLADNSMVVMDVETRAGNSGSKFQNGDTLFARITPCLENGKTGFVQFLPDEKAVACGSTEFIVLRSRTLTPEYVYCLARSDEFRGNAIKSMTGASGRQRVQEQCFGRFFIAEPPRNLLDRFSAIVSPNFRHIQNLYLRTGTLRQIRDLMLPRLLSGVLSFTGVGV